MTPDANDLCVFAVKRGYIESKEIYCNPLYPTYLSLVEKYQHSPYANGILNNHVAVNPKTDCSLLSDSSEVSFVPMANPWIRSDLITALIDIIESIQKRFGNIQTAEHEEAFGIALSNALNDAKLGENGTLLISSGLLFLLVALYYNIEISSPSADAVQYKDRLLTWSEKYQITDAQIDTEQNAASNAECIEAIFNRYVRSTEQTIFMSRCFSAEYNETENAIRRAINEINNEKKTGIMLIRVDEHHEGTTGQISDRIFRDIESAGLVIADLSSGKLNVPHEIGYAMGLKKDLILVHNGTSEEAEKHIPSNIRMFEQIRFNGDYQTLQNEIKRRLIDYYKL